MSLTLKQGDGKYLAFLGRVSPEKGLDEAIEIARRSGLRLKIAAKVDPADLDYFENCIKPLLDNKHIDFIGEIGNEEKNDFLGNAAGLLFPIQWPEPFGIVMIEALACGTPVIAYRSGSVPEVIEDGVTGFIVEDAEGAVDAVNHLREIDRRDCRKHFERNFSDERMARDYLNIYSKISKRANGHLTLAMEPSVGRTWHPTLLHSNFSIANRRSGARSQIRENVSCF